MVKIPNWCNNQLTITGPKEELKRFKEFAKGKGHNNKEERLLCTENFIPYPEKFKRIDELHALDPKKHPKDGFNSGGYEYSIKAYGTKWGICEAHLTETKDALLYGFDTAWSPPCPVIKKMGEMFPKLRFELYYEEPGNAFKGTFMMEDGENMMDESSEYIEKDEEEEK